MLIRLDSSNDSVNHVPRIARNDARSNFKKQVFSHILCKPRSCGGGMAILGVSEYNNKLLSKSRMLQIRKCFDDEDILYDRISSYSHQVVLPTTYPRYLSSLSSQEEQRH